MLIQIYVRLKQTIQIGLRRFCLQMLVEVFESNKSTVFICPLYELKHQFKHFMYRQL
jgi:hypothetical protein